MKQMTFKITTATGQTFTVKANGYIEAEKRAEAKRGKGIVYLMELIRK